jgi:AcrR family transcriptional regulator
VGSNPTAPTTPQRHRYHLPVVSTEDRILLAAEELLVERELDDISLNELCTAADVSTSSLYHRFKSKDELASALHARLITRSRERLGGALQEAAALPDDLSDLVLWGCRVAARHLVATEGYLTSMAKLERTRPDLWEERAGYHATMITTLVDAIAVRAGREHDVRFRADADLAVRVVASSLLGAVSTAGFFAGGSADDLDGLCVQLALMVCRYLQLPLEPGSEMERLAVD